jgi:hypothetical protein
MEPVPNSGQMYSRTHRNQTDNNDDGRQTDTTDRCIVAHRIGLT